MSPIRELMRTGNDWTSLHGGRGDIPPPEESDSFVLGETKPNESNTGLNVMGIDPNSLTVVSGNVTHSTNDAVYENIRFTGRVSVRAKRVTYRNCWFNPVSASAGSVGIVSCTNVDVEDAYFENCLFHPSDLATVTRTTGASNCIMGHDFTLYRCHLYGAVDNVGLYSGVNTSTPARNVQILGSYLHGMTFYSPDPGHSDNQSHNDCVQIHGGAHNFLMRGTTAEGYILPNVGDASTPAWQENGQHAGGNSRYPSMAWMAVFMATPRNETAGVNNFVIDQNWLGGGMVVINWSRDDAVGLEITNNRWTRGTALGDNHTVLIREAQPATITGNHYEDTLEPWNGRIRGG